MLSELLPGYPLTHDVRVLGLCDDSRRVSRGDLFCAVQGEHSDGRDFIAAAVGRGAVAVVSEPPAPVAPVPVVPLENLAGELGMLASRFHGDPTTGMPVVAVTGTNGKTSCTHLLAQALAAGGLPCGLIGSLGYGPPEGLAEPGLTTPPALELHRRVSELLARGCEAIVLEASSHGLVQGRLNGVSIDVAVFTNLTHDHLDYHGSFAAYGAAKASLFDARGVKHAVINVDDEYGQSLARAVSPGINLVRFSLNSTDANVYCSSSHCNSNGITADINMPDGSIKVQLPLYGLFNVANVLAVAASLVALGWRREKIETALQSLKPVVGRMDVFRKAGEPTIIIDYAHTPDALEKSLGAVADHFDPRRLWCVFGCGGDRDPTKRPLMGEVAVRLADQVVITNDNPRTEDASSIVEDILQGTAEKAAKKVEVLADRSAAIVKAVTDAGPGDVVLIAGKGHEDYQELATGRVPFSDYQIIGALGYGKET